MKKEELRLAIVIYGGASLAVYMHGVTKELFKLVQASKRVRDRIEAAAPTLNEPDTDQNAPPADTEDVYANLLWEMNGGGQTSGNQSRGGDPHREFRVVIDVIAGASAGAINGSMLAKALVDNLPLDAQTDVWLTKADVDHLTDETVNSWRRIYTLPFLKAVIRLFPPRFRANSETRTKLERFLRKAWLVPPLSGKRLCNLLLDALAQVSQARPQAAESAGATAEQSTSSLLPYGQRLDFYASITDLFGYPRSFRLNESTVVRESEHAVAARLLHVETPRGRKSSDFRDSNNAALVWAARASSSYAGAFPPFHHSELMEVLEARGESWDATDFLQRKLLLQDAQAASDVFDPADRYFVDGGIVNNKPFAAALEALHHRPSDRGIDRCIVYIEPIPNQNDARDPQQFLKFFGTIRAAVSTIPRNQPILTELTEVADRDANARINQRLINSNRASIDALVTSARSNPEVAPDGEELLGLRQTMRKIARAQMGVAFEAYNQRRVWRLSEGLIKEWQVLLPGLESRDTELAMIETVERWLATESEDSPDPHATFLHRFDVTYRIRRLQFVIRSINQRFTELDEDSPDGAVIGNLKLASYATLQTLYGMRRAQNLQSFVLEHIRAASTNLPLPPRTAVTMLRLLSRALRLPAVDRETDTLIATHAAQLQDHQLRESVLADYAGFALYDVLLTSGGTEMHDTDPLTRLRIERISPDDSVGLRDHFQGLRSRDLMSFAGFFNRSFREHDYLWGRLNGADRAVDLLSNAAGELLDAAGQAKMRRALFLAILDSEQDKLLEAQPLLKRLREELG